MGKSDGLIVEFKLTNSIYNVMKIRFPFPWIQHQTRFIYKISFSPDLCMGFLLSSCGPVGVAAETLVAPQAED